MPRVTQAPAPGLPEAEQVLTDTFQPALSPEGVQAVGASTSVTQAQRQALNEYKTARKEYEARRTPQPGRLPMDRTSILVALQLKVEAAKQRCSALGIDPAIITARAQEIRP